MMNERQDPLLKVSHLRMHFPMIKGLIPKACAYVKAVEDVSFEIEKGKTLGLVGESGCGKTTIGKCILRVHEATSGTVLFHGQNILDMSRKEHRQVRRKIQMIFQDPYGSLDPRQTAFDIVREMYVADGATHSREEAAKRVNELMTLVGRPPELGSRYPHEMSGGQRQRLGIARALACSPELLICDEPVSALDVSIQAQVINLFKRLQRELSLSYLFIAHDLVVVRHIADQIIVMYLGHIVEVAEAEELCRKPYHPYTQALLSAIPGVDYDAERARERIVLEGEVPSPTKAPSGCPFHPRCPYASEACQRKMPKMKQVKPGHQVACYRVDWERKCD